MGSVAFGVLPNRVITDYSENIPAQLSRNTSATDQPHVENIFQWKAIVLIHVKDCTDRGHIVVSGCSTWTRFPEDKLRSEGPLVSSTGHQTALMLMGTVGGENRSFCRPRNILSSVLTCNEDDMNGYMIVAIYFFTLAVYSYWERSIVSLLSRLLLGDVWLFSPFT